MSVQDEALTVMVQNALAADRRISGHPIVVRVAQGEVFLKGVVDTHEQRDLAVLVAKGAAGVRHVVADELRTREADQ